MERIERFFRIHERGSTVGTEVRAGVATFLTMAYILFVNPQILAEAGMPVADVTIATALGAAIATLVMGLYANYPFALAPGMGLNAYFTYGVVLGMGETWQTALTAVFLEGLIFIGLSFGGVRTIILNAIPHSIKRATAAGIGLFLALIGFRNAGLVVDNPATLVGLGDLQSWPVLLALLGVALIAALESRKFKGGILVGIVAITVITWLTGLAAAPASFFSMPSFPKETFLAFEWDHLFTGKLLTVVIAFLFVDIFDTAGTLLGVGRVAGFLNEKDELPNANKAFTADAVGTVAGAALGTSTVTTFIESGAGVEEGGRTGLTAVVVSFFFLLALFFTPIFTAVPAVATAPALIVVGALMIGGVVDLDWRRLDESVPAFLTVAMMPFTYSIANGVVFGLLSWVVIKVISGRAREVHGVLWILAGLLAAYYSFLRVG
ncbi:NCS2 family permease [Vulgatibacter sp.]|uniref:NCS2 family permease n=1 Tax=Vulgatibacter sp. TaxID=1971226 RepID=UPI0035691CD0